MLSCVVPAGFDVLTAMERIPVDADDRPEQEIKITGASVFVNPYKDMEEEERQTAEAERKQVRLLCLHTLIHACSLTRNSPTKQLSFQPIS